MLRYLFCALALVLTTTQPLSVTATPKLAVGVQDVKVLTVVEHDARNRFLYVGIAGDNYESSSVTELEGDNAPRFHEKWFKRVPPGHYEIQALVQRNDGRTLAATDSICIAGFDISCTAPQGDK